MEITKDEISSKIKNLLTNYVEVDIDTLDDNMSLTNDIGIDSFSTICLVGEIENAFNIQIQNNDLVKFRTLGDVESYIQAKVSC